MANPKLVDYAIAIRDANRAKVRAILLAYPGIYANEIVGMIDLSLPSIRKHIAGIRADWKAGLVNSVAVVEDGSEGFEETETVYETEEETTSTEDEAA